MKYFHLIFLIIFVLSANAYGKHGRKVTLRWERDNSARKYEIEVGTDPILKKVIRTSRSDTPSVKLEFNTGNYFFRVRSLYGPDNKGPWSDVQSFQIFPRPPKLIYPKNSAEIHLKQNEKLRLRWEEVNSLVPVQIEIRDNAGPVLNRRVDAISLEWKPDSSGKYKWRMGIATSSKVDWGKYNTFQIFKKSKSNRKKKSKDSASFHRGKGFQAWAFLGGGQAIGIHGVDEKDFDFNQSQTAASAFASFRLKLRPWMKRDKKALIITDLSVSYLVQSVREVKAYLNKSEIKLSYFSGKRRISWGPYLHFETIQNQIFFSAKDGNGDTQNVTSRHARSGLGGGLNFLVGFAGYNYVLLSAGMRFDFSTTADGLGLPKSSVKLGSAIGFNGGVEFFRPLGRRFLVLLGLRARSESFSWPAATATATGDSKFTNIWLQFGAQFGYKFK